MYVWIEKMERSTGIGFTYGTITAADNQHARDESVVLETILLTRNPVCDVKRTW